MALENIHRAMGSLAYTIAMSDGEIQVAEKNILLKIANETFQLNNYNSEHIKSMFDQLEKQEVSIQESYDYAIDCLKASRFDDSFNNGVKHQCVDFMRKVAISFGEVDFKEQSIIEQFIKDIDAI
jgi:tellurite resistance protein